MFFVFSKLLKSLIHPATWLVIGFLYWVYTRHPRRKSRAAWILVVVALLFSNTAIINAIAYKWQYPLVWPVLQQPAEAGVLLTGMTFTDQKKQSFFGGTADRFIQAAKLYHQGKIKRIIISGGNASLTKERPSEAAFLQRELQYLQIPAAHIIIETNSRNTYENAINTRKLLDSLNIQQPVLLITSAMHLRRAMACYQKQNIAVKAWPANIAIASHTVSWKDILIPNLETLLQWPALLHEIIGYYSYRLTGKC